MKNVLGEEVEQEVEMDKVLPRNIFGLTLASINFRKNDIWDDEIAAGYSPFVINMILARDITAIMYINQLNQYPNIPKDQHYQYLLHGLPKGKRFGKGVKKDKALETQIAIIQDYFGYNRAKAEEALKILTKEQTNEIKNKLNKGGKK